MSEEPGSHDLEYAMALIRIRRQLDGQEPSDEAWTALGASSPVSPGWRTVRAEL